MKEKLKLPKNMYLYKKIKTVILVVLLHKINKINRTFAKK